MGLQRERKSARMDVNLCIIQKMLLKSWSWHTAPSTGRRSNRTFKHSEWLEELKSGMKAIFQVNKMFVRETCLLLLFSQLKVDSVHGSTDTGWIVKWKHFKNISRVKVHPQNQEEKNCINLFQLLLKRVKSINMTSNHVTLYCILSLNKYK